MIELRKEYYINPKYIISIDIQADKIDICIYNSKNISILRNENNYHYEAAKKSLLAYIEQQELNRKFKCIKRL